MKKIITILVVAIVALTASAQKGMMGVGVLGGGSISLGGDENVKSAGELELIFQYNCSGLLRIQPYVNAIIADEVGVGVGLNFNLFLAKANKIRPFIYAGGGFVRRTCASDWWDGEHENFNGGDVNVGIGLDYRVSHKVTLMVQMGAQIVFHTGRTPCFCLDPKVGVCYNF